MKDAERRAMLGRGDKKVKALRKARGIYDGNNRDFFEVFL
jgi:hypothetical protein